MFNKKIQRIVFIILGLLIFLGVYIYLAGEYMTLPSDGWSKGEPLFEYEASSDYLEFFNKQIAYVEVDGLMTVVYYDGHQVAYKSYHEDLSLADSGQMMSLDDIDELYASHSDDGIELLVRKGNKFYFYGLNQSLKLKRSFEMIIDHPNYHISNCHIVLKDSDILTLVSSRGITILKTSYKPYDIVTYVSYEQGYHFHYLTLLDQSRHIVHDYFDESGVLLSSRLISNLVNDETRLTTIDFQVKSEGHVDAYAINLKDFKFGTSYLNYYKYSHQTNHIIYKQSYEALQDKTTLVSSKEMIGLFNHDPVANFFGKKYYNFFNVMKYNLLTSELKPLTRTFNGPREYHYIVGERYDYLIWGELSRDKMQMKIASNNPDYIIKSTTFNRSRLLDVFLETIDAFMDIPTYIIINGVGVLAIVMLIVMPGYMMFVTFFERNRYYVFILMVIIHNVSKVIIHSLFVSKISLPGYPGDFTWLLIVLTNLFALYNYMAVNSHRRFDNPITAYVPFYITDILLHTLVFGPFILMQM